MEMGKMEVQFVLDTFPHHNHMCLILSILNISSKDENISLENKIRIYIVSSCKQAFAQSLRYKTKYSNFFLGNYNHSFDAN